MQKICGTGKMCFFLKQDPDPLLKFWFAGSGSGRKWDGSVTLVCHNQKGPWVIVWIILLCFFYYVVPVG